MAKFQVPEVQPALDVPEIDEIVDPIRTSDVTEPSESRTDRNGRTRLTAPALGNSKRVGQEHDAEPEFQWVWVKRGRISGSLYLIPTNKDNPDRVRLCWYKAGTVVQFSLNKVLKASKTHIPKGYCLVLDAAYAKLKVEGPALELKLGSPRFEAIQTAPAPKAE